MKTSLERPYLSLANKEAIQLAKDVKCVANSCLYWKSGNRCSAKNIMIEVFAEGRARTSGETGCQTFVPKEGY